MTNCVMNKKIKVVAFDFFDTLVSRSVNPEVILAEWSRNICVEFQLEEAPEKLFLRRKNAEKSIKGNGVEEPKYCELIKMVYDGLINDKILTEDISFEEFYEVSEKLEFEIELNYTELIEEKISLVRQYKEECKKIVIISDSYLPRKFYLEFLRIKKVDTIFDEVYVSSEFNARKSSGSLYEIVLMNNHIKANELLMIGDNRVSDEIIPSEKGIYTMRVLGAKRNPLYRKKDITKKIISITKKNYKQQPFNGYISGILLFIERLYKNVISDDCRKLLFFSREGENLKRLFDTYQNIMHPTMMVKTQYVYVSRRATLLPSLKSLGKEDFSKIFSQYSNISIGDFMYSIGFSKNEIKKILNTLHIDSANLIDGIDNTILKRVICFEEFIELYEKKRIEQRRMLSQYFLNFIDENNSLYIVDIGWKGSIQDNIYDALQEGVKIKGYYWGVINAKNTRDNEKIGLMFADEKKEHTEEIFSYNHIELEKVFAASHGQVLEYEQKEDSINPVISIDKNDIEIYQYIREWQNIMNYHFGKACYYIKNSIYDIESMEHILSKMYLYHQCVNVPYNRKIYLEFRKKAKENFGNISGIKIKLDRNSLNDIKQKREFYYVDYSYRILDKFHLGLLSPLASLYSKIVYLLMSVKILNQA